MITDQDLIGFVLHEARLIDEQRFEEWLDLFAEDEAKFMDRGSMRVLVIEQGETAPEQLLGNGATAGER